MSKFSIDEILNILDHEFPETHGELNYSNPFELLIAVTLSAQTTDAAVNKVTPKLFASYPTPELLSHADPEDVEKILSKIGLYRNKTKFIIACSQQLVNNFNGVVPRTRDELVTLSGVGRKTANVVLSEGFGIPAIAVDTHIERVAKRLGLAKKDDNVLQVEQKLMKKIPKEKWARAHLLLLLFGRYYSTARSTENIDAILVGLKEKHNL
ncbi:endonuclease III [Erysipelothrix sp. HDW6C]|uniref:endonuclease III n=1 Tax=Erysipelothrix sp. HDW6C TaxID=2714930 RepID=UPI0014089FF1|nr:endonuclease III [Erysipelothrix sp. HDW6C]QIK69984.1 endonuclease III [Erysipelothrix sp. HDW6C]